jgi:CheY-like chemotaxis protein
MNNKILVVEDDPDLGELLAQMLLSAGYSVELAGNGQEALDRLRAAAELPNLVLLDLMMPLKDGPAFREEQVRDPLLADLRIVIMSADAHIEDKRRRMQVHATIRKPFDMDDMLRTVKQNIR